MKKLNVKPDEPISLRDYAHLCRTTHQTVSAAVKAGKIVKGYDAGTQKILPTWADIEWGLDFMAKKATERAAALGFDNTAQFFNADSDSDTDNAGSPGEISKNSSPNDLYKFDLYYKVLLSKQKFEKEEGILVNKEAVYRQLFAYGQGLRSKLESIPNKVIDTLITMDRDEGKNYLAEEINSIIQESIDNEQQFNTGDVGRDETDTEDNSMGMGGQ